MQSDVFAFSSRLLAQGWFFPPGKQATKHMGGKKVCEEGSFKYFLVRQV